MRPFIVSMTIVLILAGCSGGDGTEASPDASDGEPTINGFIPGAFVFDEANAEQQHLEQERAAQEKITACMSEQGFEYIPYVHNQGQMALVGPDSQEEFVEQYGFGIATMLLDDQRIVEMNDEEMEAEMAKDPNNAIVEAMTVAEREAYYAALHGEAPYGDIDSESMTEEETNELNELFVPSGCQYDAYEELFNNAAQQAFNEQFGPMMEDIYASVQSDPRIVEMEVNWSSCMAEKGYDFTDRNDIQIYLLRQLEEVGAITGLEIDPDGMGFGYGGAEIEPGSPVEAAVDEIASEEIAIAKDSLACSGDQEKVQMQVYEEAEQRFIQENRAELEQFKKDHS